jgi:hypothetical protein
MATQHQTLEQPIGIKRPRDRRPKWLTKAIVRTLVCVAILLGIGLLVLAVEWPFTKQALIDVLQERSVRSVRIEHFRITYFPPGCVAEGISFLHRKHKNKPPLITISKLEVRGSYSGMITPHKRLSSVRVYGMHVTVPPPDPNGGPNPVMPLTQSNSGRSVIIGTVMADGAVLDFIQKNPANPPVHLVLHKLALDGVGKNRPLDYRTVIYNPSPAGTIESSGQFGTWNPDNPAQTPVKGWFQYLHGNLGMYKAIRGTLASQGSFDGTLSQINVTGKADVPNFHVTDSSHTRDLAADFHAIVNATDGNVFLNDVLARFDRTAVLFSGAIEGHPGKNGKAVSLEITSTKGRIEDLLNLFIEDKQPPVTGNVSFASHFELPPQPPSFVTGMKLQGDFGVGSGKFTNADIQSSLSRISENAAKKDRLPVENPATLVSNLQGKATVENGVAHLSALSLRVPGAAASLSGTYSLVNYDIDLHGTLITDGSASAATTGFKSFLLKTMSPFLKKKSGKQTVPFKITGDYRKVQIGLDLGHKKRSSTEPRPVRERP